MIKDRSSKLHIQYVKNGLMELNVRMFITFFDHQGVHTLVNKDFFFLLN